MARFENKQTNVKGIIFDPRTRECTDFDIMTNYTRSNAKAIEFVTEELNIEPPIIVSITELINQKSEPKVYNNSKVIELAEEVSYEERENWRKATMYNITGFAWLEVNDGQFETEFIEFDTPTNLTKTNVRQSVAMHAEELYEDCKVLAVANCEKIEFPIWVNITPENLAKCEVKKSKKNDKDTN